MAHDAILQSVCDYYNEKITVHGPTHRGVDWNSPESQELRFRQLLKVTANVASYSILDYGCGYGALLEYISRDQLYVAKDCRYLGFDVSLAMIEAAKRRHRENSFASFRTDLESTLKCDFAVASGIFNVKGDTHENDWHDYVWDTIRQIDELSEHGFAFNMLTSYADVEYMQEHLYYANPGYWFDKCMTHYSRQVALCHDYGLYEFTIVVQK
jgi:SAM-dependent methyltransferase